MSAHKGFTLIELLVVVLIIGILASVAMPQYFKSVEKSRSAEAYGVATAVVQAQERRYMQTGSYATNLADLDIGISNLSYFTINNISGGNGGNCVALIRKANAGAGLGKYVIRLQYPAVPGEGVKSWTCRTEDNDVNICKALLPS